MLLLAVQQLGSDESTAAELLVALAQTLSRDYKNIAELLPRQVHVMFFCCNCHLRCCWLCCRYVSRKYNPLSGDVSITGVEEEHGIQTALGDLLFLKGNAFPGLLGEHSFARTCNSASLVCS